MGVVTGRLEEKEGHTGLEVAARRRQNVSIDEKSLRCVHTPGVVRAPRECDDLRIDEVPIHNGVPHGLLHCKWGGERGCLLYGAVRIFHRRP